MKPELVNCLKGYGKKDLSSDLFAGLLVAIIALPLSIAMGIQSGVTLQAGLLSAIIGGLCIAAFSGSRFSIGGPSATFIAVTVAYLADPDIGLTGMQLITVFAGLILIVAGFLRAGKALKFVPYPIIIGFTAGIGVILLIGQAKDFFGLVLPNGNPADFFKKLYEYGKNIKSFNFAAFALGVITLLIIYLLPKLTKKVPSIFVAVVVATLLSLLTELIFKDKVNIPTIGSVYGDVKATFNFLDFSALGNVKFAKLILPAFIVALLSALEGLMSAMVAEGMTNRLHDPNMELIGHGIGNAGSGLFGGIPVTGALARTYANINAGAKSPLSGIFHAAVLFIMYIVLMPVMKFIPFAALAAVLIRVSISMSRFPLFVKFITFGVRDSIILSASFLLTVFLGVVYGVLIGLGLAFAINIPNFIKRLKIEQVKPETILDDLKHHADNKKCFTVSGALFFVSVNKLIDFLKQEFKTADEIVLDMTNVERIDATSVERLAKLTKSVSKAEKRLNLLHLNQKAHDRYVTAFEQIIGVWK